VAASIENKFKRENQMKSKDEILDLGYEISGEDIFFSVNGKRRFKMVLWEFLGLIDRDKLREVRKRAEDPAKDFTGLGLQEYVTIIRLIKKGMSLSQAASVIGIPEPRLRSFFNYARNKYITNQGAFAEELRQQIEAGRDYVKTKKRPMRGLPQQEQEPDTFDLVDLGKVKSLVNAGMEPFAIAEKFNLDADDFKEWYKVNEPLLAAYK